MTYRLPSNYRRNVRPVDFDDHAEVTGKCAGWEWQPDVYPFAADVARMIAATTIVDVGCGAARKSLLLVDEFELIGLDRAPIVGQITDNRGTWVAADLERPGEIGFLVESVEGAVIVCSDVIEHLVHPEVLVGELASLCAATASTLVLSTPDRVRTRGSRHRGPSPNRGHVQEWTLEELSAWLVDVGFALTEATWTRSNDHEPHLATCLIEATA